MCPCCTAQVQYGYINIEEIFRGSSSQSVDSLVGLLVAKIVATSVRQDQPV